MHTSGGHVSYLFLAGRLFFGGFFIVSGLRHFIQLPAMAAYAKSKRVPAPRLGVLGSGSLALLGGLSVALGAWPRYGVVLLVVFLVPVSLMMHNYWADADPQTRESNQVHFMKNLAMMGAALMFLAIPEPWEWGLFP
jgi:putative oxidoreductase